MKPHHDTAPGEAHHGHDSAYRRMLDARAWVRRWLSPEVIASIPADAPEVVGVHTPDVMRTEPGRRAIG